jgi:hypothetical protein
MARVYATADDYQTYAGQTPPADIGVKLADASRMLDAEVFRLCYYQADPDTGQPTVTAVAEAFRDATCAQAQWWIGLGDSLGADGAGWNEVRIGTVMMRRPDTAISGADSAAREVAPKAWDALQSPDLHPDVFRLGMVVGW